MAARDPNSEKKTSALRRALERLMNEHASPRRLGLAVALGIYIGCSPLYGIHTPIALGLAWLLRLNKVAAVLGSQISIAPLAPFLTLASVQLGSLILSGELMAIGLADFKARELGRIFGTFAAAWAIGSVITGLSLGSIGYLLTVWWVRRRRRP